MKTNPSKNRKHKPKVKKDSIPKMGYGQHNKNKNTISKIEKAKDEEKEHNTEEVTVKDTNAELPEDHTQVCVWEGTVVGESKKQSLLDFFKDEMGVRAHYLEEVLTSPDKCPNGHEIPETGGRNDLFFSVHKEDVMKFALPRLQMGIRWVEDVLGDWNNLDTPIIYPERVKGYMSWDDESLTEARKAEDTPDFD